jgi:hypothetical protein
MRRQWTDFQVVIPLGMHSADAWKEVLDPVAARYRGKVSRIYFRADAGFANPEVYEFLEAERSSMRSGFRPTGFYRSGSLPAQAPGRTTAE